MPKALYLKYRPQTFAQIQGQEHVTQTLENALALGRIGHAYLFSGPRGTGKTSTARILAKAVNCLSETEPRPCNKCTVCQAINDDRLLDLIEIDAASNTGVDDIRELREKVDFRPSESRFKVYIIDEAHMLSNAAFNALLKTLEEPPPHVIFILATTETNKIPPTISSRCQRFEFRRASYQELTQQLESIAAAEGLDIEPVALELIARQATGSFRDATSLLDQLMAFGGTKVTLRNVQSLLGAASHETVRDIVACLGARELPRGLAAIEEAIDDGVDPRQLSREIVDYLRGVLLSRVGAGGVLNLSEETYAEMKRASEQFDEQRILRAIRLFNQAIYELRGSTSPSLPIEVAFVESIAGGESKQPLPTPPRQHSQPAEPEPKKPRPPSTLKPKKAETEKSSQDHKPPVTPTAGSISMQAVADEYPNLLARLRAVNKPVEALLLDAQPLTVDGNLITIGFFYELHKNRVEGDKRAKAQIEKILSELLGEPCHVRCVISPKKQKMQAAQDDPLVRAALKLGGEIRDVS